MKVNSQLKSGLKYTILKGDSLSKIANKFYGNGELWNSIYHYKNNFKIIGDNPNIIYPGVKIDLWNSV